MGEGEEKLSGEAWKTSIAFEPQSLPLRDNTIPAAGEVHLWYLDLGGLWLTLTSALGGEEAALPQDVPEPTLPQLRFARRFYLRTLLGSYLGVPGKDVSLVRGERGKPVLDSSVHGEAMHFSLAKSGRRILVGVSGAAEVGVDLELETRKLRKVVSLSRRFFTPREAGCIANLPAAEQRAAFMRTWACKEAVAKASGHGIANRFCRFVVSAGADAPPSVVEDLDLPNDSWQVAMVSPEPGYLAAVATRQPGLSLNAFRIGTE